MIKGRTTPKRPALFRFIIKHLTIFATVMGRKKSDIFDINLDELPIFEGIDLDNFIDTDEGIGPAEETRYIQPPLRPKLKMGETILYRNAAELAKKIGRLQEGQRFDVLVSGDFIMGDFILAHLYESDTRVEEMTISTLSMSQTNVDVLKKLLEHDYIKTLNLVISDFFFSHERRSLIPYIYQNLDFDNRFQLAVADLHTKTLHANTTDGRKIVMHGSANLRSSANIEQFTLEENATLYDFYKEKFDLIIDKYKTINKSIRVSKLWDVIDRKKFND